MIIKAFIFDLYGTIIDMTSINNVFLELNIKMDNLKTFIEFWQSKQLGYAWSLNLSGKYDSFSNLSSNVLCRITQTLL